MKPCVVAAVMALALSACRSAPEGADTPKGYEGIERIQILAKGME